MNDLGSTFLYIIIMIAVIIGAYITTKLISGKARRLAKSKYITVIDRMVIAKDKQILLIEVGGDQLLIGVTNQSVNIIKTIDKDTFDDESNQSQDNSHKGFFGKIQGLIIKARENETTLKNARMNAKKTKTTPSDKHAEDDFLEKMSRAIEQRKNRIDSSGDGR